VYAAHNPRTALAKAGAKLRAESGGAAYVEFIIAVVPLFLFFWGMLQLNGLFLADILTQHAAVTAARAAVVCEPDDHSVRPEDGQTCASAAVREVFGMDGTKTLGAVSDVSVSLAGASASGNAPVTATVTTQYECEVPMVGLLVCGFASGSSTATIIRKASLPNQGAYYAY
jgi:Flp pilus assembly protein TadG